MHTAIRIAVLAAVTGSIFGQRFAVRDTRGAVHSAGEWRGHPAVVLFFVTPECPLSNSYVPEMNRIHEEYANRGVLMYAVQPDFSVSQASAASYARDYRYAFPMLLDAEHALVRLAGATVTPQVAVLSGEGKLLYRGRIDNRAEDFGVQRTRVTSTDLRDVLDAVMAGKPVDRPRTKSIGCAISPTPGERL
jgi:thiol-disulfide isomerase/thioredoxin